MDKQRVRAICFEFTKFSAVGVFNTAHHYCWYLILRHTLTYSGANVAAFLLSMIGSFFINSYFTYNVRPNMQKFIQFPFVYIAQLAASYIVPGLTIDIMHLPDIYIPIITTAISMPVTYVLSRYILKC